jgi:hypothetical protein
VAGVKNKPIFDQPGAEHSSTGLITASFGKNETATQGRMGSGHAFLSLADVNLHNILV